MRLFFILFLFGSATVIAQPEQYRQLNLNHFSSRIKNSSTEYLNFLPSIFAKHPEAGMLPFNHPPVSNCFELLQKRNAFTRYFLLENSNGSHFFQQRSASPINFLDKDNNWREINYRLHSSTDPKIFSADEQPNPLAINVQNGEIYIVNQSDTIFFAKELSLVHLDDNGNRKSFGSPDFSHYSVGDDGVYIKDFYKNIDVLFSVKQGKVEISFVLNVNPGFVSGSLRMEQRFYFSDGLKIKSERETSADYEIVNKSGNVVFAVGQSFLFDSHSFRQPVKSFFEGNKFIVSTPVTILNQAGIVYPIIIDPTVSSSNTLPVGSITGSGFSAVCWTGGCNYGLVVPTPANATLTNMYFSFEYFAANGLCEAKDGGFSINFGGCIAPATAPGVYSCQLPLTNFNCGYTNEPLPEFNACFPVPQCAPQNLNFTLNFFRCNNDPSGGCSSACISASQPWIMTIEGETLALVGITPATQNCVGASVQLQVLPDFGVQPYSYLWTNGALTDTTSVSPVIPTVYNVVVTDLCGSTVQGSVSVTPANNTNPGFTFSANPVCVGETLTISGNGAFPVTDYDWTIPGAGIPGNSINDNQFPTAQYSIAGNYPLTLMYRNGACRFDSTLNISVTAPVAAQVNLSALPAGTVCIGDPINFTATPTNGGTTPLYTFLVDGVVSQSGTTSTFSTTSLSNGALVQVILTSNATCTNPLSDTASLFAAVNPSSIPAVNISSTSALCEGDTLRLNANPVNGGPAPTYQWQVNGFNVSNGPTLISTSLQNGDIVSVTMTSTLACVNPSTANSNLNVILIPRVFPNVTITVFPIDSICPGQAVQVNASLTNTTADASYRWFVNSIGVGDTTEVYNSTSLRNGDVIQVIAIVNGQCLNANRDTSNVIRMTAYPPLQVAIVNPPAVCKGIPVFIQANITGGKGNYHYSWNITTDDAASVIFVPDTSTIVRVSVIDDCGLSPVSTTVNFNVLAGPVPDFNYYNPEPYSFKNIVQFTNQSSNYTNILWIVYDLNDTTFYTESDPVHQFSAPGEYNVTLITQSANGCLDSVVYRVLVKEDIAIYFPNAFTPDGDGNNDLFIPLGASLLHFSMIIYNRWGEKVYEGDDKPWDGLVQRTGKPAPQAVYVYRIDLKDSTADKKVVTGRVTVIR